MSEKGREGKGERVRERWGWEREGVTDPSIYQIHCGWLPFVLRAPAARQAEHKIFPLSLCSCI